MSILRRVVAKCINPLESRLKKSYSKQSPKMCTDIVWMDLEMTGLDISVDKILEIACLITDKDLNIKSEGPCLVIKHKKEVLTNMNEWCQNQHNKSGLVQKVLDSQIDTIEAENMVLEYLKSNIPRKECPLAGNSIYMDRLFLRQVMPKVNDYLHYRIIDVSTVKELAKRWNPPVYDGVPKKECSHRSLEDLKESIAELQYYREQLMKTAV